MINKIETKSKWIYFVEKKIEGRKTSIYCIFSKQGDELLGEIRWFGSWRKYSFYPQPNTIFETTCLNDIIIFINELMVERKNTQN